MHINKKLLSSHYLIPPYRVSNPRRIQPSVSLSVCLSISLISHHPQGPDNHNRVSTTATLNTVKVVFVRVVVVVVVVVVLSLPGGIIVVIEIVIVIKIVIDEEG